VYAVNYYIAIRVPYVYDVGEEAKPLLETLSGRGLRGQGRPSNDAWHSSCHLRLNELYRLRISWHGGWIEVKSSKERLINLQG